MEKTVCCSLMHCNEAVESGERLHNNDHQCVIPTTIPFIDDHHCYSNVTVCASISIGTSIGVVAILTSYGHYWSSLLILTDWDWLMYVIQRVARSRHLWHESSVFAESLWKFMKTMKYLESSNAIKLYRFINDSKSVEWRVLSAICQQAAALGESHWVDDTILSHIGFAL